MGFLQNQVESVIQVMSFFMLIRVTPALDWQEVIIDLITSWEGMGILVSEWFNHGMAKLPMSFGQMGTRQQSWREGPRQVLINALLLVMEIQLLGKRILKTTISMLIKIRYYRIWQPREKQFLFIDCSQTQRYIPAPGSVEWSWSDIRSEAEPDSSTAGLLVRYRLQNG